MTEGKSKAQREMRSPPHKNSGGDGGGRRMHARETAIRLHARRARTVEENENKVANSVPIATDSEPACHSGHDTHRGSCSAEKHRKTRIAFHPLLRRGPHHVSVSGQGAAAAVAAQSSPSPPVSREHRGLLVRVPALVLHARSRAAARRRAGPLGRHAPRLGHIRMRPRGAGPGGCARRHRGVARSDPAGLEAPHEPARVSPSDAAGAAGDETSGEIVPARMRIPGGTHGVSVAHSHTAHMR